MWTSKAGNASPAGIKGAFDERTLALVPTYGPQSLSTGNQSYIAQTGSDNVASTTVIGSGNRTQQQQVGFRNDVMLAVGGYAKRLQFSLATSAFRRSWRLRRLMKPWSISLTMLN